MGAADISVPKGILSAAERDVAEIAVRRFERQMRNICAQRLYRGCELPSIMPAMMFSRARRSTRKTSACVV